MRAAVSSAIPHLSMMAATGTEAVQQRRTAAMPRASPSRIGSSRPAPSKMPRSRSISGGTRAFHFAPRLAPCAPIATPAATSIAASRSASATAPVPRASRHALASADCRGERPDAPALAPYGVAAYRPSRSLVTSPMPARPSISLRTSASRPSVAVSAGCAGGGGGPIHDDRRRSASAAAPAAAPSRATIPRSRRGSAPAPLPSP